MVRSEIRIFVNFFIWGVTSLIFFFAGKFDSETVYLFGLFMYAHLFWSHFYDIERLEKRLKHVKAAYKSALNTIYGTRVGYTDTDNVGGSADRTNTDCKD